MWPTIRCVIICFCAVIWLAHADPLENSMPKRAYAKLQGQVAKFGSDDCVNWGVDEVRGFVLTCAHSYRCESGQADFTVLYRVYFGHGAISEIAAFCSTQNADLKNSTACEEEAPTSVSRKCWNEGIDSNILIDVERK